MADRSELRRQVIDALTAVFGTTDWAPPDGGIIVDAVVIMGWVDADGDQGGISWFGANNGTWVTEGLLRDTLRALEAPDPDDAE